ncbi:MAG: hypothetical protein NTZ67_04865 [Gammaproteobacteria bacterium]|nr:hypothetical protein [Gammaproteobacteria bacterium]
MDFSFLKKEKAPEGLCCIYLLPDEIIVTHIIQNENDPPTVTFIEVSICQLHSLKFILDSIIKKHNLKHAACSWVLHPSYYQLFLLDPPSVSASEMSLALRWQIKELITFPAQNAAIEYFSVPSTIESKSKIYVAAAEKSALQAVADIIDEAELNLQFVDILQLALRNINALYGDESCFLGILLFHQNKMELVVTHEKNLLLSRQLLMPEDADINTLGTALQETVPPQWLNDLTSEIQRSFTFCKSQQQKELPAKLLIAAENTILITHLGDLLGVATEQLQIEKKLNFELALQADEYFSLDYLIALGGALRL